MGDSPKFGMPWERTADAPPPETSADAPAPKFDMPWDRPANANVDGHGLSARKRPEPVETVDALDFDTGLTRTAPVPATAKYEDYPTLGDLEYPEKSFVNTAKLQWGLPFTPDVEGKQRILHQQFPEAKFEKDKYGNPLFVHKGSTYHIARPDTFNTQNVNDFITTAIPSTIAATGAALIPGALPVAMGAQAAAGAGSSVLGDIISKWAGSNNPIDYTKAGVTGAITGAIPLAGKAAGTAWNKLAAPKGSIASMGRGVGSLFDRRARNIGSTQIREDAAAAHPSDLTLHEPEYTPLAAKQLAEDPRSAASGQILQAVNAHEGAAGNRVAQDVLDTFGPHGATAREMQSTLTGFRKLLGPEFEDAIQKAKPVDVAPLVQKIEAAIAETAPNTPKARALAHARSMLVEKEGVEAVAPTVDAKTGAYVPGTGAKAVPAQYVSTARKLEDARQAFDSMLKYGDPGKGIGARAVSPQDRAIQDVRGHVSSILKESVPGYEAAMQGDGTRMGYAQLHEVDRANKRGLELLKGGKNAIDPEEIKVLMSEPHTAEAFRLGARDAIETALSKSPDEVRVLAKLGGGSSITRQNLEALYGPEVVDKLLATAGREGHYRDIAQHLREAHAQGRHKEGAQFAEEGRPTPSQHVADPTLMGLGLRAWERWKPPIANAITGRSGPGYYGDIASALTAPAKATLEDIANVGARNPIPPTTAQLAGLGLVNPPRVGAEERRPGHASGGAVKVDHAARAASLVRAVPRVRKEISAGTAPMLKLSDNVVTKALAIANQGLT